MQVGDIGKLQNLNSGCEIHNECLAEIVREVPPRSVRVGLLLDPGVPVVNGNALWKVRICHNGLVLYIEKYMIRPCGDPDAEVADKHVEEIHA